MFKNNYHDFEFTHKYSHGELVIDRGESPYLGKERDGFIGWFYELGFLI
jgi:hypothetical protein